MPANSILGTGRHTEAAGRAQPSLLPGVPADRAGGPPPRHPPQLLLQRHGRRGFRSPPPQLPAASGRAVESRRGAMHARVCLLLQAAPTEPGEASAASPQTWGDAELPNLDESVTESHWKGPHARGAAALELCTLLTSCWGSEPKNHPAEASRAASPIPFHSRNRVAQEGFIIQAHRGSQSFPCARWQSGLQPLPITHRCALVPCCSEEGEGLRGVMKV